MRCTIAVVVLLVAAPLIALAADPPGGPGWYQLDITISVQIANGDTLTIAAGTPGFFTGVSRDGLFRIRFERGIVTQLGREITTDAGAGATLTLEVPPELLRAFVKQPLSKKKDESTPPKKGGAEPGALGAIAGTGAGLGGTRAIGVKRDTVVTVEDAPQLVSVAAPVPAMIPPTRQGQPDVFGPRGSSSGGGTGGTTRVIGLEEHDARLKKILALLGEDGATCETKPYGPGWVSICEPARA
jgi:hypothetical protein